MHLASLLLVVEIAVTYAVPASKHSRSSHVLDSFPAVLNDWRMTREFVTEKEFVDLLKADTLLNRSYGLAGSDRSVDLFAAYFESPRAGIAPHSPKVCLPASGWTPTQSGVISFRVPGRAEPVRVNRYLISRGDQKILVLYWYQTYSRMAASEYAAKFNLILDSLQYRRSETTFIRVAVPVAKGREDAEQTAMDFVRAIFTPLQAHLPLRGEPEKPASPAE
jgi:EpsI family protein